MTKFKEKYTLQLRKEESDKIINKYPDRIPVIVEKHHSCEYDDLQKTKFLAPKNLTIGQFVYIIRKNIKLSSEKSIFVTINGILPTTSSLMLELYENNKEEDNFLDIVYSSENTFG
jgi:GABA(A) receptor-associated protein